MKMPERIAPQMFAPCGMNCAVCYRRCASKKPCAGCLSGEEGKPARCRVCKIKDCAAQRGLSHCFACGGFPCKAIEALEKSYNKRYRVSLVQNSLMAREQGISALMESERRRWTCPRCGGVVSLHDARCGECLQDARRQ